MIRVLLINAGPTQWDADGRLSGSHTLPLTPSGHEAAATLVETLPAIDAVYCYRSNDACNEVAGLIAARFSLRVRDNANLEALSLGLWQGLRPEDLKGRFPTVFPQWLESPAAVIPPEGESFDDAMARLAKGARTVLRRNGGKSVAIVLRPLAMQIMAGIVRREEPIVIAAHLHKAAVVETIELEDDAVKGI